MAQGLVRTVGVSNYGIRHLEELAEEVKKDSNLIKAPAVNQIDLHPFMQRKEDVGYCEKHGIVLEVCYQFSPCRPRRLTVNAGLGTAGTRS